MKPPHCSYDWRVEATMLEGSSCSRREDEKSFKEVWIRALKKLKDPKVREGLKSNHFPKRKSIIFLTKQTIESNRQERQKFKNSQVSVISPLSQFYTLWLSLMSVCILYSITVQPYLLAFYNFDFDSFSTSVDLAIELIFIADLITNFNLAFFDDDGILVFSRRRIFINYLKTWLVFDLVSSIPFTLIDIHRGFQTYQIFPGFLRLRNLSKLLKGLKLNKLLSFFPYVKNIDKLLIKLKDLAKFFKFFFSICLAFHISSCLFYLAAKIEDFSDETWVMRYKISEFSTGEKYLTALYWSITTLCTIGFGDIVPFTLAEKIVGVLWICVGVFTLSYSISYLNSVFANSRLSDLRRDQVLKNLEELYNYCRVPKKKLNQAKQFVAKNLNFESSVDKHQAVKILSHDIRSQIAENAFHGALEEFYFFNCKSQNFKASVGILLNYSCFVEPKVLWKERERPNSIVFVVKGKGKMEFFGSVFMFVGPGNYFGDVEVVLNKLRVFEAALAPFSEVLVMDLKTIEMIKDSYSQYWNDMKNLAKSRFKRQLQNLAEVLVIKNIKTFELRLIRESVKEMYLKLKNRLGLTEFEKKIIEIKSLQDESVSRMKNVKSMLNKLQY